MAGDRIIANIVPPRSDALGVARVGQAVVGGDAWGRELTRRAAGLVGRPVLGRQISQP